MDNWLFVTLIFIGLVIFLALIIWIDWVCKCRKSAKDNDLKNYLSVFYAFGTENKNEIIIVDGILGVNISQLVFANRFKDDSMYLIAEISKICGFELTNYDENEFFKYVKKYLSSENEKITYVIRSMAGVTISKRLPKSLKTRKMCKISLNDGLDCYFFYKDTPKNIENIKKMQKYTGNKFFIINIVPIC